MGKNPQRFDGVRDVLAVFQIICDGFLTLFKRNHVRASVGIYLSLTFRPHSHWLNSPDFNNIFGYYNNRRIPAKTKWTPHNETNEENMSQNKNGLSILPNLPPRQV